MKTIVLLLATWVLTVSASAKELKNCDGQPLAVLAQCLQDNISILTERLAELVNRQATGETDRETTQKEIQSLAALLGGLTAKVDDLRKNLKTVTINYCTGEYTPANCGGPRFDPRDYSEARIAQELCSKHMKNFNPITVTNRSQSGGCCGYGWYTLTCTGY